MGWSRLLTLKRKLSTRREGGRKEDAEQVRMAEVDRKITVELFAFPLLHPHFLRVPRVLLPSALNVCAPGLGSRAQSWGQALKSCKTPITTYAVHTQFPKSDDLSPEPAWRYNLTSTPRPLWLPDQFASSMATSSHNSIASLAFSMASSSVSPAKKQLGRSGTHTINHDLYLHHFTYKLKLFRTIES